MNVSDENVLFCSHCGNSGILKFVSYIETPYDNRDCQFSNSLLDLTIACKRWNFYQCPVCQNPTLVVDYISRSTGLPIKFSEPIYEFPKTDVHYDGVPEIIRTAFESAVKTKGIDRAICVMSLRRTLEMICKEKGASGKDLKEKISNLIERNILPEMMSDACWIVRQSGNDAAHADDIIFTEREVQEIIEYVSTVINYLYSMPVRILKLKQEIEQRKKFLKQYKAETP